VPEDLAAAVAAEIRRLLAERQWSGRELARRTGLSTNSVAVKLRGDSTPFDVGDIDVIAAAFGVTPANLIAHADAERSHS
jgi:transcriptional regulator with XRE-family HTH domain